MNYLVHGSVEGGAPEDLASLVAELGNKDGMVRRQARRTLVDIGPAAVPGLIRALSDPQAHARWEAAKALCEIQAPEAAPALVQRLEDENFSVRWLAAEALISIGTRAVVPLLYALARRPDDIWLRQGAHHVLRALLPQAVGEEHEAVRNVLAAIEGVEPILEVPVAAERALHELAAVS